MLNMQNNRGDQPDDITLPSNDTNLDLSMNDSELETLVAHLEITVPTDIVNSAFRESLMSKLIDIQAGGPIYD